MEIFLNLNFTEQEIKNVFDTNNQITNVTSNEITNLIDVLRQINCNDVQIKNIIIANPFYLNRVLSDVVNLIDYLNELKFSYLNLLFDSNPFLLNKDVFEIKEFIINKQKEGYLLDDIIDMIDNNPFIMEEI